ncbi:MAG: hypothetical protein ACK5SX_16255 [Sandaracinobacter sp.]
MRSKKGAAPAAEQPASTPVLDAPPIPGAATTDTAPGAEATPGAAEGASAPAAPGPEAPAASDTAEPAGGQAEDVTEELSGDAVTATEAAEASTGADGLASTDAGSPAGVQPDIETSGLAQDLGEIRLKVTAKATKSCARLLWLEGQERTFVSTDLDPSQLLDLDEDPDFELDFFKA